MPLPSYTTTELMAFSHDLAKIELLLKQRDSLRERLSRMEALFLRMQNRLQQQDRYIANLELSIDRAENPKAYKGEFDMP